MRHLRSVPPPKADSEPPPGPSASSADEASKPLTTAELSALIARTSRTFALILPLLDEPLYTDVGIAFVLLRIADCLEEAPAWTRDTRMAALDSFGEWLIGDEQDTRWEAAIASKSPSDDQTCLSMLARAESARAALRERGSDVAMAVTMDIVRTTSKMAEFIGRQSHDERVELRDLADVHEYCYVVSGIVGELLTELFLTRDPSLEPARDALMDLAPALGEGVQLVELLRSSSLGARARRTGLPSGVDRAEVVRLARAGLVRAMEYVEQLERAGAAPGLCDFCEVPVRLAEATLDRLEKNGIDLTHDEVKATVAKILAQR